MIKYIRPWLALLPQLSLPRMPVLCVAALLRCGCFLHLRTIHMYVCCDRIFCSDVFFLLSTRNATSKKRLLLLQFVQHTQVAGGFSVVLCCDIVRRSGFAPLELLLPREVYSRPHDHLDHPIRLQLRVYQTASHIKMYQQIIAHG